MYILDIKSLNSLILYFFLYFFLNFNYLSCWEWVKSIINKENEKELFIDNHTEMEKQLAMRLLKENNGDIFKTYISIFDFLVENKPSEDKKELFPNICKNLIIDNRKLFEKAKAPPKVEEKLIEEIEFMELLDKELLKKGKETIFVLLKHLNYAMRTNLLDGLSNGINIEIARNNLLNEIEILKGGIYTNA